MVISQADADASTRVSTSGGDRANLGSTPVRVGDNNDGREDGREDGVEDVNEHVSGSVRNIRNARDSDISDISDNDNVNNANTVNSANTVSEEPQSFRSTPISRMAGSSKKRLTSQSQPAGVVVVDAFEEYAYDSGMRVGDRITAVNGVDTTHMTVDQVRP